MTWILQLSGICPTAKGEQSIDLLTESIRKEIEAIRAPEDRGSTVDRVIVCGDFARPPDLRGSGTAEALRGDFATAREVLAALLDRVADGDWDRLIVVPGLNDLCHDRSAAAMRPVQLPAGDEPRRQAIGELRRRRGENVRWCWSSLRFFEVIEPPTYADRFGPLEEFVDALPRRIVEAPDQPFRVHVLDAARVCIVAFSSCHRADHITSGGLIAPDHILAANDVLTRCGLGGYRKVAVWHHDTRGEPFDDAYMSQHVLDVLARFGYTLALHSNHSRADRIYRYTSFAVGDGLSVVSTPLFEPQGGLNVLRIDNDEVRVWSRRRHTGATLMPLWLPDQQVCRGDSRRAPIRPRQALPVEADEDRRRIQHLRDVGRIEDALRLIERIGLGRDDSLRAMWVDFAYEHRDYDRLARCLRPRNEAEDMYLIEALLEVDDRMLVEHRLDQRWAKEPRGTLVRQEVDSLRRRLDLHMMRGGT